MKKHVEAGQKQSAQRVFALMAFDTECALYELRADRWLPLRVEGEEWHRFKGEESYFKLIDGLSGVINRSDGLQSAQVYWLVDHLCATAVGAALPLLLKNGCANWQILRWEILLQRAMKSSKLRPATARDAEWLGSTVLPMLHHAYGTGHVDGMQENERSSNTSMGQVTDRLVVDIRQLQLEKAELQAQVEALRLPNIEHLIVFLPAVFRNFWGRVRPDELGLLAGTLRMPNIPSPFPDPGPETVASLKRRLLKLPPLERDRVIEFSLQLVESHGLEVRQEMRDLLQVQE